MNKKIISLVENIAQEFKYMAKSPTLVYDSSFKRIASSLERLVRILGGPNELDN